MQEHNSITARQLWVLLVSMMLGVGVLTIPREVTQRVMTPDSWMSVLMAFPLILIPIIIMGKLTNLFPDRHFVEYVPLIIGKLGTWAVGTAMVIHYILLMGYEARMLGNLVRQYLMDRTPMEVIILPVLFASAYLILGGIRSLVRVNQLFLPILLTMFALILLLALQNVDVKNLQPFMAEGIAPVIRGIPAAGLSLLGIEVMFFYGSFVNERNKITKMAIWAAATVIILNTVIVLVALGQFGTQATATIIFTTLELVKSIELPGGFLERVESLFLTIWIMAIFTTISISHFISSHLLASFWNRKTHTFAIAVLPVVFIIAMLPKGLIQVQRLANFTTIMGGLVGIIIPAGLLLLARIRRLGTYGQK